MVMIELVTYCGGYCGLCGRWKETATLVRLAKALAELADAHGYQHWMPEDVKEFNYTEFRKALGFFSDENSWLVCKRGCKGGDGNPFCEIRNCCKNLGLDLCFDCGKFPCDKVKDNPEMIKGATEYRKLGKDEWLTQMVQKAKQGWEGHTKKYYQICIKE